jgi:thiamine-monophosphate kinase
MRLRDLGEFGLIDRIERAAHRLGADRGPAVVLGIGDDAALLRPRVGEDLVVTTDTLVEDVHFQWSTQSPMTVGRRALVANLSDLAAMGARPLGFLLALSTSGDLTVQTLDGVIRGLLRESVDHACPIVGGNVARARETTLHITALGAIRRGRALRRDGARPGDRICVTGRLGGVALDVARALQGRGRVRRVATPRLRAGRALGRAQGIGACIDVSDGLLADLDHVLAASACAAELDLGAVPRPRGFAASCRRLGLDADDLALRGGEDHELLFTVRPSGPSVADLTRRLGVEVAAIGRIVAGRPGATGSGGWRHF